MTHFQRHMPFTKEDKILIKYLFELKRLQCSAFSQRVSQKKVKCQQCLQVVAITKGYWLVDRRPGSADDATPAPILLTNWCYTKMASPRNNYLHRLLYI